MQGLQHLAELGVHKTRRGVISAFEFAQPERLESEIGRLHRQGDGRNVGDVLRFGRQRDGFQRIQIKPLLDGDIGHVRTIKAAADEERFVLVGFEQLDGFGGDLAIGLLLIGAARLHPAERSAEVLVLGNQFDDFIFVILVPAGGVDDLVPRGRIVNAAGADLAGHAVVEHFPNAPREVAGVLEHLRQGKNIGKVTPDGIAHAVLIQARGVGPQAEHQRTAARSAQRILAIGAVKAHRVLGEAVEVRRLGLRVAVTTNRRGRQVVNGDEQHIGAGGGMSAQNRPAKQCQH